jgi:hypothetical protein
MGFFYLYGIIITEIHCYVTIQADKGLSKPGRCYPDHFAGCYHRWFLPEGGKYGQVYAMDIQVAAINSTYGLLKDKGLMDRVILIKDNHVNLLEHLHGVSPRAALFNLGYLPGGDKKIITRPDTTIEALNQTITFLAVGGWISIVFYTGHEGGREEYEAVSRYLAGLPQSLVTVMEWKYLNQLNHPPGLLLIHKVGEL